MKNFLRLAFTALLLAGSLAELLASIPSHLIVRRRPGCFVGIGTMMGIMAGVYVMLFCFGPMIRTTCFSIRLPTCALNAFIQTPCQ